MSISVAAHWCVVVLCISYRDVEYPSCWPVLFWHCQQMQTTHRIDCSGSQVGTILVELKLCTKTFQISSSGIVQFSLCHTKGFAALGIRTLQFKPVKVCISDRHSLMTPLRLHWRNRELCVECAPLRSGHIVLQLLPRTAWSSCCSQKHVGQMYCTAFIMLLHIIWHSTSEVEHATFLP